MRPVLLIMLVVFCHQIGRGQNKSTKEETLTLLREKLATGRSVSDKNGNRRNYTKMCVNFSLLPEANADPYVENPKIFKDKIVSNVSWGQDEIDVQNNIFISGKLRESYTYQVPLTAIVNASITNCKRNMSENVNAYVDRPIFIAVRKNTTRISHQSFDKNGKATCNKGLQYHMNNKDADWESEIPIAGNWDSNSILQDKIVKAFNRLAELNEKGLVVH